MHWGSLSLTESAFYLEMEVLLQSSFSFDGNGRRIFEGCLLLPQILPAYPALVPPISKNTMHCLLPLCCPHCVPTPGGARRPPPPQPCPVVSSKPACHFQVRIMIRRENTRPPGSHPECQGLCSKEVHSEQWWLLTFGPDCSPWWGGCALWDVWQLPWPEHTPPPAR